MADKKLFGKYNDLLLLLIGFLLTGVVGTLISHYVEERKSARDMELQRNLFDYQNEAELKDRERTRAERVFEEISSLLDERLWNTRRFFWAKKEKLPDDITLEREKILDITMQKWHTNLNKNEQLLSRYFGTESKRYFDEKLLKDFIEIGKLISRVNSKTSDNELKQIETKIKTLNRSISKFDRLMLDAIKIGNIGVLHKKDFFKGVN